MRLSSFHPRRSFTVTGTCVTACFIASTMRRMRAAGGRARANALARAIDGQPQLIDQMGRAPRRAPPPSPSPRLVPAADASTARPRTADQRELARGAASRRATVISLIVTRAPSPRTAAVGQVGFFVIGAITSGAGQTSRRSMSVYRMRLRAVLRLAMIRHRVVVVVLALIPPRAPPPRIPASTFSGRSKGHPAPSRTCSAPCTC
jgi:hypothetical protein